MDDRKEALAGLAELGYTLAEGAAFVGVGGRLLERKAIAARDPGVLRAAAEVALAQVRGAGRSGQP